MKCPKVEFKKLSLEENIKFIKDLYNEKNNDSEYLDLYGYLIEMFPEIKDIDDRLSLKEKNEILCDIVTSKYNKELETIDSEVIRYSNLWNKYNDKYMLALSCYLNIDFPIGIDTISAYVGLMPVAPRFLNDFSFWLNVNINDNFFIETVAHELCHFVWFTKWKELFPDSSIEDYESPSIIWQYSEMVVDPILNSNDIHSILGVDSYAYDSFYSIYDGNNLVMENLKNLFNSDESIETKIATGFEYVNNFFEEKTNKKMCL